MIYNFVIYNFVRAIFPTNSAYNINITKYSPTTLDKTYKHQISLYTFRNSNL